MSIRNPIRNCEVQPPMSGVEVVKGGIDGSESGPAEPETVLSSRFAELAGRSWFWPVILVGGYFAQLLFRISLVIHRAYPSVQADESSYLVLARVLAGRSGTEMPNDTVIPGGYSLLISPALRLADNPVTAYHLVLDINAVVNALMFPLLFVALRRLALPRPLAALTAFAAALLPPVIFYSEFAMADAIFQTVVLCWVITMHGWLSEGPLRRRYWFAGAFGLATGYAMAVHDRGTVMAVFSAVLLVLALVFNWAPRRTTLTAFAVLAVGVAGAEALSSFLTSQFTAKGAGNANAVLDGLENGAILGRTIVRTFGQFWYLMISSWGIGAIGLALCIFAAFSSRIDRAGRIVSVCLVLLMGGIALASAASLGDDPRIDNWVYARYLSPLVPIFFLIGAAVLYHVRRRHVLFLTVAGLGLMVLCAEIVILYAGKNLYRQAIIAWAMPDALFMAADWTALHIWQTMAGVTVVVAGCVLMRMTGGRQVLAGVMATLVLLATFATSTITTGVADTYAKWRKVYATDFTKSAGVQRTDQVAMDWNVNWNLRMTQNYEIYWGRMWTIDMLHDEQPPATATLAVLPYPQDGEPLTASWPHPPAGWHVDRSNKDTGWVTWRRNG
ncbi:hypothetical protein OG455_23640 [Kitasatospora sp. NBC_01287]|uniref:hypothetical protein n=1 Tax=Kitasatospora sp. NBC_01287 TaxID=2903573 RepID=UPI002256F2D6|nr:hypothetical protein [Kitasatospora sp. NBC_01287]MCX4748470.1 hypothetical protein [Kitasatospora sp. NBC_01287]